MADHDTGLMTRHLVILWSQVTYEHVDCSAKVQNTVQPKWENIELFYLLFKGDMNEEI